MLGFACAQGLARAPSQRVAVSQRPARLLVMRTEAKKSAKLTFAKDMKGNPVWTLRSAAAQDVEAAIDFSNEGTGEVARLTEQIIRDIFVEGQSSVVCEASVKGPKEGDSYKGVVLGCVVADVLLRLRNPEEGIESPMMKFADLLSVEVSDSMPDPDDVRKKLVLGALKQLKGNGCSEASRVIPVARDDEVKFFQDLGFKIDDDPDSVVRGSKAELVHLKADLVNMNPDPQKKMQ